MLKIALCGMCACTIYRCLCTFSYMGMDKLPKWELLAEVNVQDGERQVITMAA